MPRRQLSRQFGAAGGVARPKDRVMERLGRAAAGCVRRHRRRLGPAPHKQDWEIGCGVVDGLMIELGWCVIVLWINVLGCDVVIER